MGYEREDTGERMKKRRRRRKGLRGSQGYAHRETVDLCVCVRRSVRKRNLNAAAAPGSVLFYCKS